MARIPTDAEIDAARVKLGFPKLVRRKPETEPGPDRPFPSERTVDAIFQKLVGVLSDDELDDLAAWDDGIPDADPNSLHSKLQEAIAKRKPYLFDHDDDGLKKV